jgi:hypothetical protein
VFSTSLLLEFCDVGVELVEVFALLGELLLELFESVGGGVSRGSLLRWLRSWAEWGLVARMDRCNLSPPHMPPNLSGSRF